MGQTVATEATAVRLASAIDTPLPLLPLPRRYHAVARFLAPFMLALELKKLYNDDLCSNPTFLNT